MRQGTINTMIRDEIANGTTFIEQLPVWWESITTEKEGEKPARTYGSVQVCVQGMEAARQERG
jgi:hypothetical protein